MILERGRRAATAVCSGHAVHSRSARPPDCPARVRVEVKVDPARYRPNDTPLLLGDPARLREELGWRPEIPIEKTLDDLLEYWRTRTP